MPKPDSNQKALAGDWLVRGLFPERKNLLIAFVRLGGPLYQRQETYILTPGEANGLLDERYANHSPRIRRTAVLEMRGDHDLALVVAKLGR